MPGSCQQTADRGPCDEALALGNVPLLAEHPGYDGRWVLFQLASTPGDRRVSVSTGTARGGDPRSVASGGMDRRADDACGDTVLAREAHHGLAECMPSDAVLIASDARHSSGFDVAAT